MMAERRGRVLRGRFAVDVRHWTERRLGGRTAVEKPRNLLCNRNRVQHRKFGENIMRMLMIDQWLAMVRFTGLEQLGESGMRRGQRLSGKHLAKQQGSWAKFVLLHQH